MSERTKLSEEKRVIWQDTTLLCDECHRESAEFPVSEDLVGKPCRWCDASMLSQEEFEQYYAPKIRIIDRINRWFGWIPFLTCTYEESKGATIERNIR